MSRAPLPPERQVLRSEGGKPRLPTSRCEKDWRGLLRPVPSYTAPDCARPANAHG